MRWPGSLRDRFVAEVRQRTAAIRASAGSPLITDGDLARLPDPVRRYLGRAGVVGRPRPLAYQVTFTGRIRGGPDEAWMPFTAEQWSSVDGPVRLFYMRARRNGIPVAVLHRYVDGHATMTVKLAAMVTLVDADGPVLDRSETVTVFNDMCLLAPGTLLDPRIVWEERDAHSAVASFSVGAQTITATLTFGDDGLVTNFVSDDRSRSSPDGRAFTRLRFLTPISVHATFDGVVVAGQADVQWRLPDGQIFTYAEFTVQSVSFMPAAQ